MNSLKIRCLTFFSHLLKKYRDLKINLFHILIHLFTPPSWYPPPIFKPNWMFGKIYVQIHSPNTLPEFNGEDFVKVNPFTSNTFSYSQIRTELLDKQFDTNCFKYDLDHKFANFNMRSDCIMHCVQKFIINDCNSTEIRTHYLFRYEFLEQNNLNFIGYQRNEFNCLFNKTIRLIRADCEDKCKMDCYYSYYIFNRDEYSQFMFKKHLYTKFIIKHNGYPDILIKHVPGIQLISVLCNLGGIFGMWLGISILVIFQSSLNTTFTLLKSLTTFNFSPRIFLNKPRQVKIAHPVISSINVIMNIPG